MKTIHITRIKWCGRSFEFQKSKCFTVRLRRDSISFYLPKCASRFVSGKGQTDWQTDCSFETEIGRIVMQSSITGFPFSVTIATGTESVHAW